MKKKKEQQTKKYKKNFLLLENKVRIIDAKKFEDVDINIQYYLIFFIDFNTVTIFKSDLSKRKKIELPFILFRLSELLNINFRIPQKLNDVMLDFEEEGKTLALKFQDENIKNEFGDKIKKLIKDSKVFEGGIENNYTDVELKYKIAKILESSNFENFKDNYDYRKYFDFDYLNRYNQIYNNSSSDYKYLYNRLGIGTVAVVNKKSNLIRKRAQHE